VESAIERSAFQNGTAASNLAEESEETIFNIADFDFPK
jgi:hypothetical protein